MPRPCTHHGIPIEAEMNTTAIDTTLTDELLSSLNEFLLATRRQTHAMRMLQRLNALAEQSPAVADAMDREVEAVLVQSLMEGNMRREK